MFLYNYMKIYTLSIYAHSTYSFGPQDLHWPQHHPLVNLAVVCMTLGAWSYRDKMIHQKAKQPFQSSFLSLSSHESFRPQRLGVGFITLLAGHLQRSSGWIVWWAMTTNQAKQRFTKNTDHHAKGCENSANDLSQVQSGVFGFSYPSAGSATRCCPNMSKLMRTSLWLGNVNDAHTLASKNVASYCVCIKGKYQEDWLGLLCHLSNDLVLLPIVFSFSIGFQLLKDSKAAFEMKFLSSVGQYKVPPVVVPLFARVCSIIWEKHPKTSAKTSAQLTNPFRSGSTWVHPTHLPYRYFHSLSAPWRLLDFLWHFFVCLRALESTPKEWCSSLGPSW